MIKVFYYLIAHTKRTRLLVLLYVIIVALFSFFLFRIIDQRSFDPMAFLETIRSTTVADQDAIFEGIKNKLREIVATGGTNGAVELTNEAFARGDINLINCHRLMHLIGHIDKASQTKNKKIDNTYSPDLCGSGYSHGLEAQIVRTGAPDFREQLYNLCKAARATSPGTACYEGAGHAFMEETLDVKKAADLCDTIPSDGPNICYKGVFAQYTSFIGGDDGETGGRYQGGPPLALPQGVTPIAYCTSLPEKYRLVCAHEVCGFGVASDIASVFPQVATGDYPMEMRAACISNAAGARGEHELSRAATIIVPPAILSFPKELRYAYIDSSMWAFNEYNKGGAQKDWQSFCSIFTESDRLFCTGLVQKK